MNCCSPAGGELLVELYRRAVFRKESTLYVNLLLDRHDQNIEIKNIRNRLSGEVKIKVNIDTDLLIRIPGGVDMATLTIDSSDSPLIKQKSVIIKGLNKNDEISLKYKVIKWEETFKVGAAEYEYVWNGNRVISVLPADCRFGFFMENKL